MKEVLHSAVDLLFVPVPMWGLLVAALFAWIQGALFMDDRY